MIKRMDAKLKKSDKKGEMEWKIVLFVVAALGLVLLVLIATKGLGWFSEILDLLPGSISNQITKCKQLAVDNKFLDDAYCEVVEKVKTSKGKRAINCELGEIILETGQLDNPKRCENRERSYCTGKESQALEDEKLWKPEEVKINDYTCVEVLAGTFVTPPVITGSCANSNDCRNYNDDKGYCEGVEGCVWDDTKPDKCVSTTDCNSKTTSVACAAASGCTWTPNVA